MLLPDNVIEFDGRKIRVTRLEEIGGSCADKACDRDTAIYQDREGNFYIVLLVQKKLEECRHLLNRQSLTFPKHGVLAERLRESRMSVRRVNPREALQWYIDEFMNDTPLKQRAVEYFAKMAELAV
jgi:hypothetical protein